MITVRLARFEDVSELTQIQKQAFRPLYEKYQDKGNPYLRSESDISIRLDNQKYKVFCVLDDGIIVGGIIYMCFGSGIFFDKLGADEYYLQRIFISPDRQSKKIGQKAILLCEKEFENAKTFWVVFPIDLDKNRTCYERAGFCHTGKTAQVEPGLVLACYIKHIK